jgi:DnaJ-class molecular chaperone
VAEAYSTLKVPHKRADYDRKLKIKSSHMAEEEAEGEYMKDQPKATRTRDEQDPEFEAEF